MKLPRKFAFHKYFRKTAAFCSATCANRASVSAIFASKISIPATIFSCSVIDGNGIL